MLRYSINDKITVYIFLVYPNKKYYLPLCKKSSNINLLKFDCNSSDTLYDFNVHLVYV